VHTRRLAAPAKRHHNNTLRAWESIPIEVTLA
jgi:4-methoxybenzoate monooxygenase (O-demethylating)